MSLFRFSQLSILKTSCLLIISDPNSPNLDQSWKVLSSCYNKSKCWTQIVKTFKSTQNATDLIKTGKILIKVLFSTYKSLLASFPNLLKLCQWLCPPHYYSPRIFKTFLRSWTFNGKKLKLSTKLLDSSRSCMCVVVEVGGRLRKNDVPEKMAWKIGLCLY